MPPRIAKLEQIANYGSTWEVSLVSQHGEGQARLVLKFDHEPSRGEIEQGCKDWLKSLHSPPELYTCTIGASE